MRIPAFLSVEVPAKKSYYEKTVPCPGVSGIRKMGMKEKKKKKKKKKNYKIKTRPRRSFGKRPPAPRNQKGNQAGHLSERTVEGQGGRLALGSQPVSCSGRSQGQRHQRGVSTFRLESTGVRPFDRRQRGVSAFPPERATPLGVSVDSAPPSRSDEPERGYDA